MLGSIIGDIAGSYLEVLEVKELKTTKDKKRSYEERIKILDKNTPLFINDCSYTDDSVLTTAIADAILNNKEYEVVLKEYGLNEINLGSDKYGRNRFGKGFISWVKGEKEGNSYGNGSAMRIAPVGYLFDDLETIKEQARLATIPSHNNPDAILSAEIVASVIYLARNKYTKEQIKDYIEKNYSKMDFDLTDLQKNYRVSSDANKSVPQALYCFLVSNDFEDAIRKSLSIGGDADTIACIVGGISEAYYGIPDYLIEGARVFIPQYMDDILNQFYNKIKIKKLTKDMV